ncbi:mandelate racemase/muconate lactonizing protein [Candidatus Bathyarchaeota archaeon]|nr:mandelate racemase/muconate lactonizing protein [Candidatus Bathyarchaeota archaeon]
MKIVDVRCFKLRKQEAISEDFWEERLARPVDIYERFRNEGPRVLGGATTLEQNFVEISSDEGFKGIFGPISDNIANIIMRDLKRLIIGEEAFAVEKVWDIMYRYQVHGRKGECIMAISAIDCAIWDLIGKAMNEPVAKLLGGPVQEKVPAYASMLGFSLNPKEVSKRSLEVVEEGFTAMKWFFRHGPGSGPAGMQRNIEIVKTVRDAVGYDVDLMLDCWMSWTLPYAVKMVKKIERYEPAWLEEPFMPDDIVSYVKLRRVTDIPIAGGEHEYTRWGVRELLKHEAVDILQTDVTWVGGITEMRKICALASSEGIPVIPHAGWTEPSQAIIFSHPQSVCPMIEYLLKFAVIQQTFNKEKMVPSKGYFYAPSKIGLGFEPDMKWLTSEQT